MESILNYVRGKCFIVGMALFLVSSVSFYAQAIMYSSTFAPKYPTKAYPDWITQGNNFGANQFFNDVIFRILELNDAAVLANMAKSPWYVPEYACENMGSEFRLLSLYDVSPNMGSNTNFVKSTFAYIDNNPAKPLKFDPVVYPATGRLKREVGTLYSEWGGQVLYEDKHFKPDLGAESIDFALIEFSTTGNSLFYRTVLNYGLSNRRNGLPDFNYARTDPGAKSGIAKVICVKDY